MKKFELDDIKKLIDSALMLEPIDGAWQPYHSLLYLIGELLDPVLIVYLHKDAENEVSIAESLVGVIDILYLDARLERAAQLWELYEPILADVALVIFDYIPLDDSTRESGEVGLWADLSENRETFLSLEMHPGTQMGFMKYSRRIT